MKNIVIIGGGTGTFTLLEGLRRYPSNNSVIASTADDGGSGGQLRYELAIIPPGDYRQCLIGLAYTDEVYKKLFAYRFDTGSLAGHTAGNIILAALAKVTGDPEKALEAAGKLLNVRGAVLPVTLKPTTLSAILENGKKITGEHNIDEPKGNSRSKIKDLRLSPSGPVNPKVLQVIRSADVIIFGPGDLFTSIIPSLLVKGVREAINKSSAKKILVTNIMTKFGQTDGFKASDFVVTLERFLRGAIDVALVNNKKPNMDILKMYAKEKSKFVATDTKILSKTKVEIVTGDFLSEKVIKKTNGDRLKRSLVRHDSDKLAKMIYGLSNK